MAEGGGRLQRLQRRIEEERERYAQRGRLFRVVWVIAGAIVVAAGLAMVVFPGPAVIVIPIGLAMLSFEFAWAERLLDKGLAGGRAAQELVTGATRQQRLFAGAAVVCAVAAIVAVAILVLT